MWTLVLVAHAIVLDFGVPLSSPFPIPLKSQCSDDLVQGGRGGGSGVLPPFQAHFVCTCFPPNIILTYLPHPTPFDPLHFPSIYPLYCHTWGWQDAEAEKLFQLCEFTSLVVWGASYHVNKEGSEGITEKTITDLVGCTSEKGRERGGEGTSEGGYFTSVGG